MRKRWAAPLIGVVMIAGLVPAACSSATAPKLVSGLYPLILYDGHDVPHNFGPGDPKGDSPPPCELLLAAGRMEVDAAQGAFSLSYDFRDACTNEFLSSVAYQGQYFVTGRDVVYQIAGVSAQGSGLLTARTISFQLGDLVLIFSFR